MLAALHRRDFMGKRGRARKRRGEVSEVTSSPSQPLPPNMVSMLERGEAILDELRGGASFEDAIERRRNALRELLEPFDAVHLLAHVMLREIPLDPDTYRETQHDGLAFVVEFVAAELVRRPGREGTERPTSPIDGRLIDEIHTSMQEVALLESFRRARRVGRGTPEGAARSRAAMQHLMLRGPGWAWQEHGVLRGLSGPAHLETRIRDQLGFTADDAIACSEAAAALFPIQMEKHREETRHEIAAFNDEHPAHVWATQVIEGWQKAPAKQQALYIPASWAFTHIGDAMLIGTDDLAARAGVSADVAGAYLRALATSLPHDDDGWLVTAEFVRNHPYLDFGVDGHLLSVPGNDLWALRGAFEKALKGDQGYLRHRGRWLEERAVDRLVDALPPNEVHRGVTYTLDVGAGESQDGEIDGLLCLGDVAVIVEAKGATLRPGARRGGEALLKHLTETLTKAAEQAERATAALEAGVTLRVDGKPIDLATPIREVHPILVTLDDLSAVAPILWQLRDSRILPAGTQAPWLVTLHELDLICGTVEWPAQLIHFLRRRTRVNERGGIDASDELDLWMHYLLVGLYFEDDPDQPTRLTSFTDPLDAWVLYEHGDRTVPAPKPAMTIDDNTRRFWTSSATSGRRRPGSPLPAPCSR